MSKRVVSFFNRVRDGIRYIRSEPYKWFVLVGNRLVIAGLLVIGFALSVVGLQLTGIVVITRTPQMLYLFQALVAGNMTLVTIVLSINQLVLSRELNTPGELSDRIESVVGYRDRVSETIDQFVVPTTPEAFLSDLLEGTQKNARKLGRSAERIDSDVAEDVDILVSELTSYLDRISTILEESQSGTFHTLAAMLETNYSEELNEVTRIQAKYEDELSPSFNQEVETLRQNLKQIDITRQYFKSVYTQSALAHLSRILLYSGVPAIGSSLLMLLIYADPTHLSEKTIFLELLVSSVVILGFIPLALLFAFILRIATVAQHTVAITPFRTSQELELDDK